ncbi:MAG: DUF427 domain-containing protein [Demequina sp.]
MKAVWNGTVIAESPTTEMVEGNHYFPRESVKSEYFTASEQSSVCPWKGQASYDSIVVNGEVNKDAAWHYDDPKERAENIRGHYAFGAGVTFEE